jgi:hypothetical protein
VDGFSKGLTALSAIFLSMLTNLFLILVYLILSSGVFLAHTRPLALIENKNRWPHIVIELKNEYMLIAATIKLGKKD